MNWSRREWLDLAARAGAASLALPFLESGCSLGRPEPRVLPSRIQQPKLFDAPLPRIPVLNPVRADSTTDYYEMTAKSARVQILPGVTTEIWGYNGIFPGPTFEAHTGRQVVLKLRNALGVPIVNHLHGGHTPPESDGYPSDFIMPVGGFTESPLCGYDAMAKITQGERDYIYPMNQRAATLWYHDHRMNFTAPQAWRGLAGFFIIRDEEEKKLALPQGGKEIPLLICDRSFDSDASLQYPSLDSSLSIRPGVQKDYMGGVLGDIILVNGAPWPNLEVANTKYRFRILNASNARRYELALDPVPAGGASFVQIGSDGGLLDAPIVHRTIRIVPAERFDVVVDFSRYRVGSTVTLRNAADTGATGLIMRFHVVRDERDESIIPQRLSYLRAANPAEAVATRTLNFSYRRATGSWTINGRPYDPARMEARPKLDSTEIWGLQTDFNHPLHLHLVHFQVLSHSGRPGPCDAGWKDVIDLGPGQVANIIVPFSGYRGRYVFHCHNLEHEDMAMMGNFEVV